MLIRASIHATSYSIQNIFRQEEGEGGTDGELFRRLNGQMSVLFMFFGSILLIVPEELVVRGTTEMCGRNGPQACSKNY
jgi:hypothetical protein